MAFNAGPALAIFSFVLWGITPLFYRLLPDSSPLELLSQRVLWSLPLLLSVRLLIKQRTQSKSLWQDKRSLFFCLLATGIMTISWCTFTYAMTHGQVLAVLFAIAGVSFSLIWIGLLFCMSGLLRN